MKRPINQSEITPAYLLGRLANGAESDRGLLIHATIMKPAKRPPCQFNDFGRKTIENDDYMARKALCGASPGRRSVGWEFGEKELLVSCERCIKKMKTP
jgi:hypothetical protein